MHCCEFLILRRLLAARLSGRGMEVRETDLELADSPADSGLHTVADVLRLDDTRPADLARRLGHEMSRAA